MAQGDWARRPLVLLGAGGHARSVAAVADSLGRTVLAVHGRSTVAWPIPVLEDADELQALVTATGAGVVPSIGDNVTRTAVAHRWSDVLDTVVASTATVASGCAVGAGSVVLEHAHVGPRTKLGLSVIVNTGAIVEHDCTMEDGSHVAPGARVLGGALVGPDVLIGAGATVLPGIVVHAGACVGAGAVAIRDVEPGTTVVGVPARPIPTTQRRQDG